MNLRFEIQASDPITDGAGKPTLGFQRKWQDRRQPDSYTVAELPASAATGVFVYATDLRVFDGAGTRETAGNGTGGLVSFNGTNWVVVGTNVSAAA